MLFYSNVPAGLLYVETETAPETLRITNAQGETVPCRMLSCQPCAVGMRTTLDASALTPWSPNCPVLYTLQVDGDRCRFGHMSLQTFRNRTVLLNGAPIYLRGYIRGIAAHDHPNMIGRSDYEAAVKNIRQAKKYGFNLVRFHSTVPSEAFVRAADELGLLIHMEIGFAYEFDNQGKKKNLAMNNDMWEQTILRFRSHPSVAIFCIGNEMHNAGHYPQVHALYRQGRELAPNKLILDNAGWGEYDRSTADIFAQHIAYFFPYKHHADMFETDAPWHINGSAFDQPMEACVQTASASAKVHRQAVPLRPTLSHEAMHYIDIPDYAALNDKFDRFARQVGPEYLQAHGIKKPRYMTAMPELIRRKGLEAVMPDYIRASRQWKLMATKIFLEQLRKSELCGFEMLQFSDCLKYENKNGIVDCFDDDKGIDPGWLRRINDDLVVLAQVEREHFYEDETITAEIFVSDFLPQPEISGTLTVTLDGETLFCGSQYRLVGGLQKLAALEITVYPTGKARSCRLRADFVSDHVRVENEWTLWLYPRRRPNACPETDVENPVLAAFLRAGTVESPLFVTDALNESVFARLEAGQHVVLFYADDNPRNQWRLQSSLERFKPCIWDRGNNLGGILENDVLREALASGKYFDLNLQPLLEAGYKINLDHFPCPVRTHVTGIDKPVRDRMKGLIHGVKDFIDDDTLRRFSHLFSLRVGPGQLTVCTFRLAEPADPVVSNFLAVLLDQPEAFQTQCGMEPDALRVWLEETNQTGFRPEDVMNHFWELDNKPVEDTLFWEEAKVDLSKMRGD